MENNTQQVDIWVVKDPTYVKPMMVTQDISDVPNSADQLLIDGVRVPLVLFSNGKNAYKINYISLNMLKIIHTGFLPEVVCILNDNDNLLRNSGCVGLNNYIIVIVTDNEKSPYRKIALKFQITDIRDMGTSKSLVVFGIMKYLPIEQLYTQSIGEKELNTFEFFEQCANLTGLGFSCFPIEHCKNEVSDVLPRLLRSQNIKEAIIQATEEAGLDENDIFDSWVDIYGYLTLVDLSYIFNMDIHPNDLKIVALSGIKSTQDDYTKPIELSRTITNVEFDRPINMTFDPKSLEIIEDINYIINDGAEITYYTFNPNGVTENSNNTLSTSQIQITNKSVSNDLNNINEYTYQKFKNLGSEFCSRPILFQKEIHDKYYKKLHSKVIKVKMNTINYGLIRGNFVNLMFFYNGLDEGIKAIKYDKTLSEDDKHKLILEYLKSENPKIPNMELSGMYYIDGEEYIYELGTDEISQILYLIKKD